MKGILDELKITREEAINRSDEIKRLAREARSSKEEVILDLTKEKPVETKPTPKPESKLPKTPQEGKTAKEAKLSQKSEVKYSEPDTLVQEAKKYKSAEEFVKAQK